MSLLSRLLGKKVEDAAKQILRGLPKEEPYRPAAPAQPVQNASAPAPYDEDEPSGFSWGKRMPNEPNQYNFNGSPREYFDQIYRAEFPDCRVEMEAPHDGCHTVFTFYRGDRTALVVELLSKGTVNTKRGVQCRRTGVPYLRFYYNHPGWWNTRAYVITRTRNALNG